MDVGIIGLSQSGKTTVFNALTKGTAETSGGGMSEVHIGVTKVPDSRIDVLVEMYNPKKVIHAEIKYFDIPGSNHESKAQGIAGQYRNLLQGADAFLIVIRTFDDPSVVHPSNNINAKDDLETMLNEIVFADLEILDRAVDRLEDAIKKSKPADRPNVVKHQEVVKKVKQGLEDGIPLRKQQISESDNSFLVNYQLLTGKPVIVAFNTDESSKPVTLEQLVHDDQVDTDLGQVSLSAKLEAELASMSDEEAAEFRSDLGLGDSALTQVIGMTYSTLGLASFLTVGEDEVRAWSIPEGLSAQDAAGTIHTDFSRGFIRAEVIPYEDLTRCGSLSQGRKEGVLRSEGKTYPVKDGDIIHFLINV
tara:strand:- start:237 stop:1322 length:1086 start_codon:yes stop_codon:yes gene_type:complete